jgi:hypothetical protein
MEFIIGILLGAGIGLGFCVTVYNFLKHYRFNDID